MPTSRHAIWSTAPGDLFSRLFPAPGRCRDLVMGSMTAQFGISSRVGPVSLFVSFTRLERRLDRFEDRLDTFKELRRDLAEEFQQRAEVAAR